MTTALRTTQEQKGKTDFAVIIMLCIREEVLLQ